MMSLQSGHIGIIIESRKTKHADEGRVFAAFVFTHKIAPLKTPNLHTLTSTAFLTMELFHENP
jgi:hypothetical protein